MKQLSLFVWGFFLIFSVSAQSVTNIRISGNKNREVWIDDINYTPSIIVTGTSKTGQISSVRIPDLLPGKHTLKFISTNKAKNTSTTNSSNFTTRAGYDMSVTVSSTGSVRTKESLSKDKAPVTTKSVSSPSPKVAMSSDRFANVLDDVRKQWLTSAKMTAATNVFSNDKNYFTTSQAIQIIKLVNVESNKLQLSKLVYKNIVDLSNFNQVFQLFTEQASRDDLSAYIKNFNSTPSPGTSVGVVTPMSEASFNLLLKDIEKQWLPGSKMTSLRNAFANTSNFFTVSQARQLILLVNDDNNRLQLAKSSYRSIVDPNNFNQIYDLLSTKADKDELASFISTYNAGSTGTSSNLKAPMSEANFNALVQNIRNQFLPGSRMSAVSNAFGNTNNYFNTMQARQLIQFIMDEANRLQLAKLSYRNIVDPANFSKLYDLFETKESKDALAAYVRDFKR